MKEHLPEVQKTTASIGPWMVFILEKVLSRKVAWLHFLEKPGKSLQEGNPPFL